MGDIASGLSYGEKRGLIGMLYNARYKAQARVEQAVMNGDEDARRARNLYSD